MWLERYEVYAAARHAEVRQILDDPATFCSSRGVGLSDFARETPWRPPSLVLERDPPEHDRARAVLNRALSATVMRSLRARFAEAAETLAAELARRGRFDAVADCAEVYPMTVLPDAVGLSKEGREHLLPYAATVFNMFGPDNELRRAALAQMAPHVKWIAVQCKRETLTGDGIGAMIHTAADAGEVTRQEAELLVRSILSAGFDTTVHGLGAAMRCLARNPDQFAALRADPTKARAAFEEAVRLERRCRPSSAPRRGRSARRGHAPRGRESADAARRGEPRSAQMAGGRPLRYRALDAGHVASAAACICASGSCGEARRRDAACGLARAFSTLEPDGEPEPLFNNTLRGWVRMPVKAA